MFLVDKAEMLQQTCSKYHLEAGHRTDAGAVIVGLEIKRILLITICDD